MKRYALLLIAALVPWAGAAEAQTSTTPPISATLTVSINGEPVTNEDGGFIGRTRCAAGVSFKFQASYNVLVRSLEAWVTRNEGQDCSLATNRQIPAAGGTTNCWRAGSQGNLQPSIVSSLTVDATKLFSPKGEACPEESNQPYWVYLVPLAAESDVNTATANPPIDTTTGVLSARFTLYTKVPDAPTGVKGSEGEQTLGVDWKDDPSGDPNVSYRVYYDTAQGGTDPDAGGSEVKCGSGRLVAGEEAPAEGDKLFSEDANAGGTSLSASIVDIGESVAVGVVTVDPAGNESLLSEIVCIERVATDGFYDRYKAAGGDGLETCSAHAPGRVGISGWSSLTLIALGLLWRRRRIA